MDPSLPQPEVVYCSSLSQQADEQLFATATPAKIYFLLENNGAWGEKALAESNVPPEVQAALAGVPQAKTLLIKSRSGLLEAGLTFFVVRAAESKPVIYAFQLKTYKDLLDLDLPAVLADHPAYAGNRYAAPLYLVCTNGRRDPCCARFGAPVYAELLKMAAGQAWQCTHVGGHRFATNLLCLPHGILYGRLRPEDTARVVQSYEAGQLDLEHYRGRTAYTRPVQAAEYYLRRETGRLGLEDFCLQSVEARGPQEWQVQFSAADGSEVAPVEIVQEDTGLEIPASCWGERLNRPMKLEPVTNFRRNVSSG